MSTEPSTNMALVEIKDELKAIREILASIAVTSDLIGSTVFYLRMVLFLLLLVSLTCLAGFGIWAATR